MGNKNSRSGMKMLDDSYTTSTRSVKYGYIYTDPDYIKRYNKIKKYYSFKYNNHKRLIFMTHTALIIHNYDTKIIRNIALTRISHWSYKKEKGIVIIICKNKDNTEEKIELFTDNRFKKKGNMFIKDLMSICKLYKKYLEKYPETTI